MKFAHSHPKPRNFSEHIAERRTFLQNILFPCLLFSTVTGIFTGVLMFSFNLLSTEVIHLSSELYAWVRLHPLFIPLFLGGIALLGLAAGLLLRMFPSARGGSLPVAVSILRGHVAFRWIPNIFYVYVSSMLTFLAGVPLGNEAPCVQMGAAVGKGTVRMFDRRGQHRAWDRYIMTGGACAGFAVATGAPISGIFFALEEAHRRFTPMVIMIATMSAVTGVLTSQLLCQIFGVELTIITVALHTALKLADIWVVVVLAVVCGLFAALFSKSYEKIRHLINSKIRPHVHFVPRMVALFLLVGIAGLICRSFVNDGHNLLHDMVHGHHLWWYLLIFLVVRSLLVILSNNVGATGGLFVPTLVFGAMLGSICAQIFISLGLIPTEYAPVLIVIGMTAYKGASMRTPITAIVFAIEVLSGMTNLTFIALAVAISYLTVELLGAEPVTEIVMDSQLEHEHEGKTHSFHDFSMTVQPGAFVIGKESRDIFWPPECVILAVHHEAGSRSHGGHAGMHVGDVLDIHIGTYDMPQTMQMLYDLVGQQPNHTASA